jgi:hypothetical protein
VEATLVVVLVRIEPEEVEVVQDVLLVADVNFLDDKLQVDMASGQAYQVVYVDVVNDAACLCHEID